MNLLWCLETLPYQLDYRMQMLARETGAGGQKQWMALSMCLTEFPEPTVSNNLYWKSECDHAVHWAVTCNLFFFFHKPFQIVIIQAWEAWLSCHPHVNRPRTVTCFFFHLPLLQCWDLQKKNKSKNNLYFIINLSFHNQKTFTGKGGTVKYNIYNAMCL